MVTEAIYDVLESDNCPRTFETHFRRFPTCDGQVAGAEPFNISLNRSREFTHTIKADFNLSMLNFSKEMHSFQLFVVVFETCPVREFKTLPFDAHAAPNLPSSRAPDGDTS